MVDITSYFDEFVKAIEHNKLHMDQLSLLAYTLGKFQAADIFIDKNKL